MKRTLTLIAVLSLLMSMLLVAAPATSAAATGEWIDRKGADLTEPYEEAKDETYEPIPGSLSSSGAFGIAGATFSLPIGKEAFKVSFDLDWVSPKRFNSANPSTAQENFFIWINYGYTNKDQMESWVGFDESKAPWETASEANFTLWSNKVGVSYPAYTDGRELSFPADAGENADETVANLISFDTKQPITDKIDWITADSGMNIAKAGTVHITLELKNDVASLNVKKEDGTDLGTAKAHFKADYFNNKTERYFAISHFNGAFIWDIKNFKVESSDISSSVGATPKGREYDADGNPIGNTGATKPPEAPATTTGGTADNKTTAAGGADNKTTAAGTPAGSTTAAPDASGDPTGDAPTGTTAAPSDDIPDSSTPDNSTGDTGDSSKPVGGNTDDDNKDDDKGGFPVVAVVIIAVVVVAGIGVAVFFVLKKKKA